MENGKIIHHLNNLSIYQSESKTKFQSKSLKEFSIHVGLDEYNKQFWETFSNDLVPAIHPTGSVPTFKSDARNSGGVISFTAKSVISLYEFLKKNNMQLHYSDAAALLEHSYVFVENLEKKGMVITCFDIADFIVINNDYFVFINNNKIVKLNYESKLIIDEPIDKGDFLSPEIENLASIPAKIPIGSTLFSLGSFVGTMLTGKKHDDGVDFIYDIYYTKVYFCLRGCLERKIEDRHYVDL